MQKTVRIMVSKDGKHLFTTEPINGTAAHQAKVVGSARYGATYRKIIWMFDEVVVHEVPDLPRLG